MVNRACAGKMNCVPLALQHSAAVPAMGWAGPRALPWPMGPMGFCFSLFFFPFYILYLFIFYKDLSSIRNEVGFILKCQQYLQKSGSYER
ncbi:hypothetical protein L873DRAFT_1195532 [Choiromyces venosus 120613-1]|uniref:Uncharacterized protein n=1 Tax=Choiromyces venosus 120613-1 TaxID=1336337 RepID=A0A3N4JEW2_9PEZI|nr:hypothetical protein L873DRAFT_1195532 [Choiromyces venosus 120613-1]